MYDNENFDPQVIYREVQGFRHPMMIAIIVAIDLVIVGNIIIALFLNGQHPSTNPGNGFNDNGILLMMVMLFAFMVFLNWFLLSNKLITEVRIDNLVIHFWPGFKRTINYEDIEKIEIVQPSGILAKRSWGYHWSPGRRYYRAPGAHHDSIIITLKNNLKIHLSSKEPDMAAKQIRDMIKSYGNRI